MIMNESDEGNPEPHWPDLESLRADIADIDVALTDLLRRRQGLAERVFAVKNPEGLAIYDPIQEDRKHEVLRNRLEGQDLLDSLTLSRTLMRLSRERQYQAHVRDGLPSRLLGTLAAARGTVTEPGVVAVQGTRDSYSARAARALYPDASLLTFPTFAATLEAAVGGAADVAVLPLENSTAGTVEDVYGLLELGGAYIRDAISLPIEHRLLGVPGSRLDDVARVVSHPQALAQCAGYIRSHGWTTQAAANTAFAAEQVATAADPSLAAIASDEAGARYGLTVLSDAPTDAAGNQTRFVAVSPTLTIADDATKISLIVDLPHRSGSLAELLSLFADRDLSLTKIQSRPVPSSAWEYRFYLDIDASPQGPVTSALLLQLESEWPSLQILGWYRERPASDR